MLLHYSIMSLKFSTVYFGNLSNWVVEDIYKNESISVINRNCAKFWIFLKRGTLARYFKIGRRPAKLVKLAIFWKKIFFFRKTVKLPNFKQNMLAGSGRNIKSWPEICFPSPKAIVTYPKCTKTYFTCLFMKQNVSHKIFFKKLLQNWKKIHIFQL